MALDTGIDRCNVAPLRVYIAGASAEIERAEFWHAQAKEFGFDVVSTWCENIRRVTREQANGDLNQGANPSFATVDEKRSWANANIDRVEACQVFWLLVPSIGFTSQGGYYEFGCARTLTKYTIASGGDQRFIFTAHAMNLADTDKRGFEYLKRRLLTKVEARLQGWTDVNAMTPPWENG